MGKGDARRRARAQRLSETDELVGAIADAVKDRLDQIDPERFAFAVVLHDNAGGRAGYAVTCDRLEAARLLDP